jgi:hypothetical protein
VKTFKKYFTGYFELSAWVAALTWLACIDPAAEAHFSLCVFKWAGFSFCPGCGLGHSVSWLFHGDVQRSFQAHPLGIFAVAVLLYRIYSLVKNHFNQLTTSKQ